MPTPVLSLTFSDTTTIGTELIDSNYLNTVIFSIANLEGHQLRDQHSSELGSVFMYTRKCRDLSSERVDSLELEKASLISATKSSLLFLIIESGICNNASIRL